jgi:hypothetical protein
MTEPTLTEAAEPSRAELLANAADCEEIAAGLLEVVDALDTGRVKVGKAAGGRLRQRLAVSAGTFKAFAARDRERAEELEG